MRIGLQLQTSDNTERNRNPISVSISVYDYVLTQSKLMRISQFILVNPSYTS